MIDKLTVCGVGLIGGSLALALKRAGYCKLIVGFDNNVERLRSAVELGVIDEYSTDPAEAVKEADMVVLAVPMLAMETVLKSISKDLAEGVILTDVGSCKASVVAAAIRVFGELPARFVPAHPIAGREKSGVEASLADLFVAHKVILTPVKETELAAIANVTHMWEATGAHVKTLGIEQHDLVLAATSHLPHVLAYSLVDTIAETLYADQIFQFAAGGFRDFSRIASSDPVMWRDICIENKDAILDVLNKFQSNLKVLESAINRGDAEILMETFASAKAIRDANVMKHRVDSD
jgi:prephenate dehydrogenase